MEKPRHEITEEEWVRYHWVDVTLMRDTERRFMRTRERTPEEAASVAREFTDFRGDLKPSGWRRWLGIG